MAMRITPPQGEVKNHEPLHRRNLEGKIHEGMHQHEDQGEKGDTCRQFCLP